MSLETCYALAAFQVGLGPESREEALDLLEKVEVAMETGKKKT